jgi:RelE toxin of RelE / RelB toxin-antitoxin system
VEPIGLYRNAVYFGGVDDAPEITVLQLPKFKAEATELIGTDGIEAVAVYLVDHPDAGYVIPGSGGARKLRWAAKGKWKRGGARIIYLYIVIAARIYLMRCYAKNVQTDLMADEKKQLRQIAAHLKGAQ